MFYRRLSVWFPALLMAALGSCALADLPVARLTSVFPPGAKQGSSVEVTAAGQDLEDLTSLRFSDARISAKTGSAPGKFLVTVGAETPVGIYDVRVVGRYGVSNPRAFVVGALSELV